jgi:HK97 family phage prohead protease
MDTRFSFGPAELLGDDEICGIAITGDLARDGDIWVPSGVDLTNFRANPVVLRQHDPDQVVGTVTAIGLLDTENAIGVRIQFAPPGASAIADETRALAKAGVLRGISAGVDPIRWEPLNPAEPLGAWRLLEGELLEISLVSIPADTGALVTQRAHRSHASLSSLTPVSGSAVRRMLRICCELVPPPAARAPSEHFATHRAHTTAAAAACQRQFDDRRQRLSANAAAEETTQRRRRTRWRRPFGL